MLVEISEDNAKMIKKAYETAKKLNERCPGLDITWREVAMLPTPDGVQISLQADQQEESVSPQKKGKANAAA